MTTTTVLLNKHLATMEKSLGKAMLGKATASIQAGYYQIHAQKEDASNLGMAMATLAIQPFVMQKQ